VALSRAPEEDIAHRTAKRQLLRPTGAPVALPEGSDQGSGWNRPSGDLHRVFGRWRSASVVHRQRSLHRGLLALMDMRKPALGDFANLSELIQLGAGGPQ